MKSSKLIILVLLLASCTTNEETYDVAVIIPLSGPLAPFGEDILHGAQMALEDHNATNKITLHIEDSQTDPKVAISAATKLIATQDIDMIYTTTSPVSLALKPIAEQHNLLLWANAAHPAITQNSTHVLRHSDTAQSNAQSLSRKLIINEEDGVVIFYQQDEWGYAYNEELVKKLEDHMTVTSIPINAKATTFHTEITQSQEAKATAIIIIAAGPAAGELIKEVRETKIRHTIYSSVGLTLTPTAKDVAGEHIKGTYYQTYTEHHAFDQAYKARYGKEPAAYAYISYTDMEILLAALDKADDDDTQTITQTIKKFGRFQGRYENSTITAQGDIIVETIITRFPSS